MTKISSGEVSDEVYEVASGEFSEVELVNINAAAIAISFWNRMNVAFQVPPDDYKPTTQKAVK